MEDANVLSHAIAWHLQIMKNNESVSISILNFLLFLIESALVPHTSCCCDVC